MTVVQGSEGMASTLLALALCLVALLLVGPEEAKGETSLSRHYQTAAPRQPLPRIARAVRGPTEDQDCCGTDFPNLLFPPARSSARR